MMYAPNGIRAERSSQGFDDLKTRVGVFDWNSVEIPFTKHDRKLQATNILFETSARLEF